MIKVLLLFYLIFVISLANNNQHNSEHQENRRVLQSSNRKQGEKPQSQQYLSEVSIQGQEMAKQFKINERLRPIQFQETARKVEFKVNQQYSILDIDEKNLLSQKGKKEEKEEKKEKEVKTQGHLKPSSEQKQSHSLQSQSGISQTSSKSSESNIQTSQSTSIDSSIVSSSLQRYFSQTQTDTQKGQEQKNNLRKELDSSGDQDEQLQSRLQDNESDSDLQDIVEGSQTEMEQSVDRQFHTTQLKIFIFFICFVGICFLLYKAYEKATNKNEVVSQTDPDEQTIIQNSERIEQHKQQEQHEQHEQDEENSQEDDN